MTVKNAAYLAWRDLNGRRRAALRTVAGLALALAFLLCASVLVLSASRELAGVFARYQSARQYRVWMRQWQYHDTLARRVEQAISETKVSDLSVRYELPVWFRCGEYASGERWTEEVRSLPVERTRLVMEGITYAGQNDNSYDFDESVSALPGTEAYRVPFRVEAADPARAQILRCETEEFSARFPGRSPYLAGRGVEGVGEIVMSDYMLRRYGVEDPASRVGRRVSFSIRPEPLGYKPFDSERWIPYLQNYVLVGVLSEDLFRVAGRQRSAQILISEQNGAEWFWFDAVSSLEGGGFTWELVGHHNVRYLYFEAKNDRAFAKLEGVLRELFETAVLGTDVVEIASGYHLGKYLAFSKQQRFVGALIAGVGGVVLLAVLANLLSSLMHLAMAKRNYFGMQRALGMGGGELYLTHLLEVLFMGLAALAVALAVSLPAVLGLAAAQGFSVSAADFALSLAGGAGLVVACSALLSALSLRKYLRMEIVPLLR